MTDKNEKLLQNAAREALPKIKSSHYFLSLFTPSVAKDAMCVLQFGYAVLLDKPLYLLVQKGTFLPENIKRMAKGIAYFEKGKEGDLERATTELLNGIAGLGI